MIIVTKEGCCLLTLIPVGLRGAFWLLRDMTNARKMYVDNWELLHVILAYATKNKAKALQLKHIMRIYMHIHTLVIFGFTCENTDDSQ